MTMKLEIVEDGVAKLQSRIENLKIDSSSLREMGQEIVESIIRNVEGQKQADGGGLRGNKIDAGIGGVLQAKARRFVSRAAWTITVGTNTVTVAPGGYAAGRRRSLHELVRRVQERGFVGWFGIDKTARRNIEEIARRAIKKALRV